ncbi:MAG: hypothetical protein ABIR18_13280, partial [Chitinophagaceae bacterium]
MAIVFLNSTICKLCNKILKEDEELYSFDAFVANANDPIFLYNDECFHRDCIEKDSLGKTAIGFADESRNKFMNKHCIIGNNLITNSDDHLFISLLTSD